MAIDSRLLLLELHLAPVSCVVAVFACLKALILFAGRWAELDVVFDVVGVEDAADLEAVVAVVVVVAVAAAASEGLSAPH